MEIKSTTIEAKRVASQLQLMAGQLDRLASHILAEAKKWKKIKKDKKEEEEKEINTPACTICKSNVQIVFFIQK